MKNQVRLPWWGLIFAAGLGLIFTPPINIITATTNLIFRTQTTTIWPGFFKLPVSKVDFVNNNQQVSRSIAILSQHFILDGCTILVHGFSRVTGEVLKTATMKKLFSAFCAGCFLLSFSGHVG